MSNGGMPEGMKSILGWALGLGILALTGLILLILFGNLQGSVGFGQTSTSFINETITLSDAGVVPATAVGKVNPTLSNVIVTNETSGELITTANYSLTGATFRNITNDYGGIGVNVSATISYDTQGKVDTDNLVMNYSSSVNNISVQFPTVGTIIGVALILLILLAVLIFAITKLMGVASGTVSERKSSSFETGGFG